jgi:predicted nuclease of predicted toxin-antitoxin system
MKFKLDENLPLQVSVALTMRMHDVRTVAEEGLSGHADADIWDTAQKESRILITQDLDFSDTRKFVPGTHQGILLIRLRSPSRRKLIERVNDLLDREHVSAWVGCFVVVTDRKVRVLKPGPIHRQN